MQCSHLICIRLGTKSVEPFIVPANNLVIESYPQNISNNDIRGYLDLTNQAVQVQVPAPPQSRDSELFHFDDNSTTRSGAGAGNGALDETIDSAV